MTVSQLGPAGAKFTRLPFSTKTFPRVKTRPCGKTPTGTSDASPVR